MELAQLNSRISVVNSESKRLNEARQVNIGKRATLEQQLNDAFATYKQHYGVDLTIENLASEQQRVATAKEKEVSDLEHVIGLIKAGNYDEATKYINGGVASNEQQTVQPTEVQPVVEQQVAQPVASQQPVAPQVEQPTTPIAQTTPVTPVAQPTTPVSQPVTPVAQPTAPVAQPTTPVSQSVTPVAQPTVAEKPVGTPPVIETPTVETPIGVPPVINKPSLSGLDMSVQESTPLATPPAIEKPSAPKLSGLDTGVDDIPAPPPTFSKPATGLGKASSNTGNVTSFNAILGGKAFDPTGNN